MTLTPRLILFLVAPPLFWAGNAVVGRLTVASVPPLMLNALRWWLVSIVLLVLGRRLLDTQQARRALAERWRYLATIGLFGVGAYNALQYMALTTSTPLNVTLIAASGPLWTMLVGTLAFGEPVRRRQLLGAGLSLLGVAVVLGRGDVSALLAVKLVPGDVLMLMAAASWAIYSWLLARPVPAMRGAARPTVSTPDGERHWNWAEMLLAQTLFGVLWASAGAAGEHWLAPRELHWSPAVVAALIYIVIGPSLLAYACWGRAVAQAGPSVAAFFANLTPLFTAVLSAAMLGEMPHVYHALAFALIVAGIKVSAAPANKPVANPPGKRPADPTAEQPANQPAKQPTRRD